MRYRQRDIVLAPFSYTDDPTKFKDRPCLVISDDEYNSRRLREVIICAITSSSLKHSDEITITDSDLEESLAGGFRKQSKVLPGKIITIKGFRIKKVFGRLNEKKSRDVVRKIRAIIEIEGRLDSFTLKRE